jgi:2-dehydro-3-deoxyphosphogluconate aldolase/(4S)-4-hydroxy-2-oxoglutarate aldolase
MSDAWKSIKEAGIIPTIRTDDPEKGVHAAQAILVGGIPIIEVSLAVPGALRTLEAVAKALGKDMIVGAGSVIVPDMVRAAVDHGAVFIVTPGLSVAAIELGRLLNTLVLAGALTPTEVQTAFIAGENKVKLFPVDVDAGPRVVRALRAEYPEVEFIASGGVHLDTCAEYIHSGAVAVGIGAAIADSKSIEKGDHKLFTLRARRFVETVKHAQARWALAQSSLV